MGSDLLVYHVAISNKFEPDIQKGKARIEELEKTDCKDWPEEYCESQGITELSESGRTFQVGLLRSDLNDFVETMDPESKKGMPDVAEILVVGSYKVWVIKGMEWQDPPSASWNTFQRLALSGVFEAMRFIDFDENADMARRPE